MQRLSVLFLLVLAGKFGWAQQKSQDPDDYVKIEKAGLAAAGAPWHWQPVDSSFGPLPASMHVFRTNDSLDGRPQIAYYVSVKLDDPSVLFTNQIGNGKRFTPAEYYKQEGDPVLVINTSFFSFETNGNLNVIVRDGKIVSRNLPSYKVKGDTGFHYMTRSALGITKNRKADVAWIYTDAAGPVPYAFERGPAVGTGVDSIPALSDLHDRHWKKWQMETAVGAGPVLVQDGKVRVTNEEEGLFRKGEKDIHPRSAIGYTRDGRLIVLAVQGRTPGKAAGVTMAQEGKILADLGCVEALNLDGGGSSCMLVNGKETIQPSDKEGERPVPSVFIIKKN